MPERQNPTGITTGPRRREALLQAALSSGALIVEDGYEEPESGEPPLSAREPRRTVWLGTLSKDLVPGFRIGWVAADPAIVERLARVKKATDFQTPRSAAGGGRGVSARRRRPQGRQARAEEVSQRAAVGQAGPARGTCRA